MYREAALKGNIHECRWCNQLSDWLDSLSWYLMRRRIPGEAAPEWRGSPGRRLDKPALTPIITVLLKLAEPAMYHKNNGLRSASLEVMSNAVYLEPDLVLPVVVQRFQEALAASNSVHQISSSIRAFSGKRYSYRTLQCSDVLRIPCFAAIISEETRVPTVF